MQTDIDEFLLHLATERGLSTHYQISVRISLEGFAAWLAKTQDIHEVRAVKLAHITDYLGHRQGRQNASRPRGQTRLRGGSQLSRDGAAKLREKENRQRNLPERPREKTDHRSHLADRQAVGEIRRAGCERLSASAAAFLRHA